MLTCSCWLFYLISSFSLSIIVFGENKQTHIKLKNGENSMLYLWVSELYMYMKINWNVAFEASIVEFSAHKRHIDTSIQNRFFSILNLNFPKA